MNANLTSSLSIRRQRAELALFFELPPRQQGLAELQCRLRVNATTCPLYGSGVFVLAAMWNQDQQQLQGQETEALTINRTLSEIRAQHRQLLHDLTRSDIQPTAKLVQHYWYAGESVSPRLINFFEEYLNKLSRMPLSERKTRSTLHKWYLAHKQLKEYLAFICKPELTIDEVTMGWARTYYQWLREIPLSVDTSARYICFIREMLHHAVEHELIAYNKLQSLTIAREAAKTVVCLTPQQLEQLEKMEDLTPLLDQVRKWALLCCYTGLDYTDAIAFARDPWPHIHQLPFGGKIVWSRLKFKQVKGAYPEWGICHIPLLPEARRLLAQVSEWDRLSNQRVNQNLHILEKRLNLPFRLTTKVCRKTAGALFLLRGYQAEAVRKIMGIKTLTVFERHYMVLLSELVDNNMELLHHKQQQRDTLSA
ncbi:site-specific integrase [Spirosoma sp. SC4-14]|uniref:site-specific integrase n=1 Tax=Spirosoma sp. SC4-14 TaxID=3128900 RepID=UPI0030CAC727